jgi:hypothetical protein
MRSHLVVCVLLLWAMGGCATRAVLVPASTAQSVPGAPYTARAPVAGVDVTVSANQWSGYPPTLEGLTALHVAIVNGSERPLRIRYDAFTLVSPSGFVAAALPPLSIRGTVLVPVQTGGFVYDRFWVAPYYVRYYPWASPWAGPFAYDPWYYDSYYGYWRQPLPTQDMLAKAMPEGVIEAHGRLAGFLYFQHVHGETVTFTMELVDAKTGETFGSIRIPFVVKVT